VNNHRATIVFKSTGIALKNSVLKEEYNRNTGMKPEGKASNCIELL